MAARAAAASSSDSGGGGLASSAAGGGGGGGGGLASASEPAAAACDAHILARGARGGDSRGDRPTGVGWAAVGGRGRDGIGRKSDSTFHLSLHPPSHRTPPPAPLFRYACSAGAASGPRPGTARASSAYRNRTPSPR